MEMGKLRLESDPTVSEGNRPVPGKAVAGSLFLSLKNEFLNHHDFVTGRAAT